MAWTSWPPANNTTDIHKYSFIIQLWKALRERSMAALGDAYFRWPRTNIVYGEGTITAMSTTTMTDSTQAWSIAPKRWVGWGSPSMNFDLIVNADDTDETKVINAGRISDNTATVLTLQNVQAIPDAITAKIISGTSALVGKKYAIIEQGGLWWSERWLQWPNARESYAGTFSASTVTTLTDADAAWSTDQWNTGYEIIVRDNTGVLRRLDITGTAATVLTFASIAPNYPVGSYKIVPTGNLNLLEQVPGYPFQWFSGATLQYDARGADGVLTDGSVESVPCATYGTFSTGDGVTCAPTSEPAGGIDADVWSGYDEQCSHGDTCHTPNIFKSLRMLQTTIEEFTQYFVEKKTYDGGAGAIPYFNPATLFKKAGINYIGTPTATVSAGSVTFTISGLPFTPIDVFYSLQHQNGDVIESGTVSTSGSATFSVDSGFNGETLDLVVALGWTRTYPRRFRYQYARTAFLPELDSGVPVTPASTSFPGNWETRAASTAFMEYDNEGYANDSGGSFTNGDLARYVGDNASDPGINPPSQGDASAPFNDYFTVTRMKADTQADWDAGMSGTATSGSTRFLTDSSKDWWGDPYGVGTMRTETGTATGGSTTTLADTSKSGNALWDSATGRWAGFILEITSGANSGLKRPISSFAGTTLTVSPAFPSAIAAGVTYQIREPAYMLNRWKDRTVTVTKAGNSETATIAYSDDKTLYFTSAMSMTVDNTCTYQINEARIGFVYERAGGAWAQAADETKSIPIGRPDHLTRYGRVRKGDVITSDLLTELYNAINELVWTKTSFGWTSKGNGVDDEDNEWALASPPLDTEIYYLAFGDLQSVVNTQWDDGSGFTDNGVAPRAFSYTYGGWVEDIDAPGTYIWVYWFLPSLGGSSGTSAGRRYAYAQIDDNTLATILAHEVDFYAFAGINAINTAADATVPDIYTFDANGDDVLYRKYSLWDTIGPSNDSGHISAALGNTALPQPNWAATPTANNYPTGSDATFKGYDVLNWAAVVRWDVSGGFTYVA